MTGELDGEITRRRFLAGAGAVATGIGVSSLGVTALGIQSAFGADLAPAGKQPPQLDLPGPAPKRLGWAIVGLGELALTQILPAFAVSARARPVALVSGHAEKAKSVADHYGIDPKQIYDYDHFDSLKDNDGIDVVYIVLPNSMHAEYTIRALKAGKHVLCEKPMATSVEDGERMIAAAKDAQRKLMIAYRLRYEPLNQHMIQLARTNAYGPIRTIVADNMQDVKAPNIRLSRQLGGGPLGDVGVYCINACRYLTGEEPAQVNAIRTKPGDDPRFTEVEDRILFQLRFPSGIIANCTAGFSSSVSRRYQVFCRDATFGLDPAFGYTGLQAHVTTAAEKKVLMIEPANHFASEIDHFSACVTNDAPPTTPGEEGVADLKVMRAVVRAADEGHTVDV